jgi:hypothetical protein
MPMVTMSPSPWTATATTRRWRGGEGAEGGDADDAAIAAAAEADGGAAAARARAKARARPLGKSLKIVGENGEEEEAIDATDLIKSLVDRVDATRATWQGARPAYGSREVAGRPDRRADRAGHQAGSAPVVAVARSCRSPTSPELTKSLDGEGGEEKPEGITANEFMAKAMDACTAGKITGLEVARASPTSTVVSTSRPPSRPRCSRRLNASAPRQRKDLIMLNPNILPNVAGSQTVSGEMSGDAVAELQKALAAGYGSDVASLQGGGALRIQSLEKTMLTTIQENQHFVLFNELAKSNATATVDEWTEQNDVGGFLGGSTNTETGNIASATGNYQRRVGLVKYLMTRREVSFVQTLQNTIADSEAVEARNGALQLLTDAEFLCFEGDSSVVPTEYDGIYAQMASRSAPPTTSSTPPAGRSTRST